MKKGKFFVRLLFLLIMGVVLQLPPVFVSAGTRSSVTTPVISISNPPSKEMKGGNGGSLFNFCESVNEKVHDKKIFIQVTPQERIAGKDGKEVYKISDPAASKFLIYSEDKVNHVVNIEFNMVEYKKLSTSDKQTVMKIALDDIYHRNNISRTTRNKIYNELCDLDTSTSALVRELSDDVGADYASAYSYLKPFTGVFGTLLGILALGIFVMLALTIVIDLAYITIPGVQLLLTNSNESKAKFVSLEAFNAIKEAESKAGSEYTNPVGVYLKSKTKQYVAIFLCLLYLVSGQIFGVLGSLIDYFRGFVG